MDTVVNPEVLIEEEIIESTMPDDDRDEGEGVGTYPEEEMLVQRDEEWIEEKDADEASPNGQLDLTGLIPAKLQEQAGKLTHLDIADIGGWHGGDPPPQDFIRNVGLLGIEQPIKVYPNPDYVDGGSAPKYLVKDGRRRIKAAVAHGKTAIAGVIDNRKGLNARVSSLAMNYQRGENWVGDAYTVKSLLDDGYTRAQIAAAGGLTGDQVKTLEDIATRLDSRLIGAIEAGKMSPWSAKMAARQPFKYQEMLVAILTDKGKVTSDDVIAVRSMKLAEAASEGLPADLYQTPDLPYEGGGTDYFEPGDAPDEMFGGEGEDDPQELHSTPVDADGAVKGKISREQRRENCARLLKLAKAEMIAIKKGARSDDEQDVISFIEEALDRLQGEGDIG